MTGRLWGTVVVTTRGGDPDAALARTLRAEGAEVRSWPTLTFLDPEDLRPLEEALERMEGFAWLAFTSPRAVKAVASRARWHDGCGRVAAVGPSTAEALRAAGWPVHLVGEGPGAEGLVEALERQGPLADARVLFFAGSLASTTLEDGLEAKGARVDRVEAYRTAVSPPDSTAVRRDIRHGVTAVLFASPSAVRGVKDALDGDLRTDLANVTAVAIGPTTAAALVDAGLRPHVAAEASLEGLVSACIEIAQHNEMGTR